jgi:hypothetical protein
MDIPRPAPNVGVDKHGAPRLAKRLGKLRGELMAGDNLGVIASECLSKQAASVPAKPVVAPQGIPVADDKSSG